MMISDMIRHRIILVNVGQLVPTLMEKEAYVEEPMMELRFLFSGRSIPELFGNLPLDRFPLLTKIIDANGDLSIQVHPDDVYAAEHENGSLGKMECWYME